MITTSLKRIAAAGAISGALSLAALGLGAGAANADDGNIPFVPPGNTGDWQSFVPANPTDWQSYFPMVQRLGDVAGVVNPGGLAGANTADTGGLANLGGLGSLGSLANLGPGDVENLLAMLG